MEGSVMRKRADALGDVGFTEPAEEERNMIETIADTEPAWKETEAPPEEKRRRLLAIPIGIGHTAAYRRGGDE